MSLYSKSTGSGIAGSGGGGGVSTLAPVGSSPNANGGVIVGSILTLEPANGSFPGVLTAADWNTFNNKQVAGAYITSLTGGVTASGPGAAIATVVTNANLTGPVTSTGNATAITNLAITNAMIANSTINLTTKVTGVLPTANGGSTGVNTGDVTIGAFGNTPDSNGATLSGQVLTLQPADGNNPGLLTAVGQTIGGSKTFSSSVEFNSTVDMDGNLNVLGNLNAHQSSKTATFNDVVINGNITANNSGKQAQFNDVVIQGTTEIDGDTTLSGNLNSNQAGTLATFNDLEVDGNASFFGASNNYGTFSFLGTTIFSSLIAHSAVVLNSSKQVTGVIPGTSGNVMVSNGTDWTSAAPTPTPPGNLTGPITSVGLATSIASQSGTGTTFVMSASPTMTGFVEIGSVASTTSQLIIGGTAPSATTTARGINIIPTFNSANTGLVQGIQVSPTMPASTTVNVFTGFSSNFNLGASSVVTTAIGFYDPSSASHIATNAATLADNLIFTGNYFLNQNGGDPSVLGGALTASKFTSNVVTGTAPLTVASTTLVPNLYVARSVLADSATTNANLTGPVTSTGNATAITNLAITNAMIANSTLDLTAKVTGALPIANGGTGQTTKAAGFDALSPMTTAGDIILGGASGTGTRLGIGANNTVLGSNGTTASWVAAGVGTVTSVAASGPSGIATWSSAITSSGTLTQTLSNQNAGTFLAGPTSGSAAAPTFRALQVPTIQKFTSGTAATYTTPAGALYIRVRMVGGGGGGGGSGTSGSGGDGGAGGVTFFRVGASPDLLVANGGLAGKHNNDTGGIGGTASLGTGPIGTALSGGQGGAGGSSTVSDGMPGGSGAASPFGGSGGGYYAFGGAGSAGATNTGSGGGGGGAPNGVASTSGSGGGAGGFVDALISSPNATYTYTVGAAGSAGSAGTSGGAGGTGAAGYIEVTEYYQ